MHQLDGNLHCVLRSLRRLKSGTYPVDVAAYCGHTDIVKLLLDSGADVNKTDEYERGPLHEAACSGHTNVVKLLLDSGADVNKTDKFGASVLHETARSGHTDVVKLLLDSGADVNKTTEYERGPLHEAACSGHTNVVKLLLDSGADVNKTDKIGTSVLHEAARRGHADVVKLLLDSGADVNTTNEGKLAEKLGRRDTMLIKRPAKQTLDDMKFMTEANMCKFKVAESNTTEHAMSQDKDAEIRKGLIRKYDEGKKEALVSFGTIPSATTGNKLD